MHATNLHLIPVNIMQKRRYDSAAKLKREHFIVTELIPTLTLNNASNASQLAVIYMEQKYS